MNITFRHFNSSYYDAVCAFLIELSMNERDHINWNWARWEWMFFHPDFDRDRMNKIGLWFCNEELVGIATYDHYFGEAFYVAKPGYEELESDMLEYAINTFSDDKGLGIAVNDKDIHTIALLHSRQFEKRDLSENVLELEMEHLHFETSIPIGITVKNLDVRNDLYKHKKVLWKGFDHRGDVPFDEKTIHKQNTMLSATNMNDYLHMVAENGHGEYVAYCGVWYSQNTDYAYVEPVCTIPEYRGKGLGKTVVLEALKRSYSLGAKKAYVISDSPFYKSMGFRQHSHYTFYWYNT